MARKLRTPEEAKDYMRELHQEKDISEKKISQLTVELRTCELRLRKLQVNRIINKEGVSTIELENKKNATAQQIKSLENELEEINELILSTSKTIFSSPPTHWPADISFDELEKRVMYFTANRLLGAFSESNKSEIFSAINNHLERLKTEIDAGMPNLFTLRIYLIDQLLLCLKSLDSGTALNLTEEVNISLAEIATLNPKLSITNGLPSIFELKDWEPLVDILTTCNPPLLEKQNNKYIFCQPKRGFSGCVANWFYYLRTKNYVSQNMDREELASIISNSIEGLTFKGSTMGSTNKKYSTVFAKQLEDKYPFSNKAKL